MNRVAFILVGLVTISNAAKAQTRKDLSLGDLRAQYRLVGALREPLGTRVTVQGWIEAGPQKGYEGGPNLRVLRVNGRATQEDIQMRIEPRGWRQAKTDQEPDLKIGETYEFDGYETAEFLGMERAEYNLLERKIGTTDFYLSNYFVYFKAKPIDPRPFGPDDFVDRRAMLAGLARTIGGKAYVADKDWRILASDSPWPKDLEGKVVEGHGTIRKTAQTNTFRLEGGSTRLVALEDQVGREVALRGRAWSGNDQWWFEYRGIPLYVENLEKMRGWKGELRGEPVLVCGRLEVATLLSPDPLDEQRLKDRFVVRSPRWEPTEPLLAHERVNPRLQGAARTGQP